VGVLCLTRENLSSPWMLFEAGAISKALQASRVIPLFHGLTPVDLPSPLSQFQVIITERNGKQSLVQAVNSACEQSLPDNQLNRTFEVWWPMLFERLSDAPEKKPHLSKVPITVQLTLADEYDSFDVSKVQEILSIIRSVVRARYEVKITTKEPGSTRVTVELELGDAYKLLKAYNDGTLPIPNVLSIAIKSERKEAEPVRLIPSVAGFDVFLCHNSADKPSVREIADNLEHKGLRVWIDEQQIRPGEMWQDALEAEIANIGSALVCIGPSGIGPWQQLEMRAFLNELVRRGTPVIPVISPDFGKRAPELPVFLKQLRWVDMRDENQDPYDQIVLGVTGKRD